MGPRKVFIVFGATGKQGGSVVKSILADRHASELFAIRAVTRDSTKPASKALEAQGVEVVTASLDDTDSLARVMKGAYAAYVVTSYWDHRDAKREYQQGVNAVDAAKEAGISHLILSCLIDVKKLSRGQFPHVYHFDSKAKFAEYAMDSGVPLTLFMPGSYMDNLQRTIKKDTNGKWGYSAAYPKNTPLPLLHTAKDTGLFVKAILLNRETTLGKTVLGASDYYTPLQIIEIFAKLHPVAPKQMTFTQIHAEVFKINLAKLGMPDFVQHESLENMLFMEPYGYFGGQQLGFSHGLLDSSPATFEEYARQVPAWADTD